MNKCLTRKQKYIIKHINMTACGTRKNENGSEKLRNGDHMRYVNKWMDRERMREKEMTYK